MDDIKKLVSEAVNGSQAAFNRLYELTEKDVWFTCVSLLRDENNAKDAMQNTYMAIFLKLDTLTDPERFRQWAKKIAVNKCKDFLKKKTTSQIDEEEIESIAEVNEVFLPEEYISSSENRDIIMRIIENTLSPVQYQAVIMYYFDEMSVSEIAEAAECPEGTVMSRLNLARGKIKRAITDYEEKNDDRLHTIVPIPLFASIFKAQSNSLTAPKINVSFPQNLAKGNMKEANLKGTGVKNMSQSSKLKIIAAICAVVIIGGAGIGIGIANSGNKNSTVPDDIASKTSQNTPQEYSDSEETVSSANNYGDEINEEEEDGFFEWDGTAIIGLTSKGEAETDIVIPKECTEIRGDYEYNYIFCYSAAENVVFENPDTRLVGKVFSGSSVKSVTLPENLKSIPSMCFAGCEQLESVDIPDSVRIICSEAFKDCTNLKTIEMSSNLRKLGYDVFNGCIELESLTLPESLTIASWDCISPQYDLLASLDDNFDVSKNNEFYVFVKEGSWADENFDDIVDTEYTNAVKEYSVIEESTVSETENGDFIWDETMIVGLSEEGKTKNELVIPAECTEILPVYPEGTSDSIFSENDVLESVVFENDDIILPEFTFEGCKALKSVQMPNNITYIPGYCFDLCESLESIEIPEGITSVGNFAFAGCEALKVIDLPSSLNIIGTNAFINCDNAAEIHIPESVNSIEEYGYLSDTFGLSEECKLSERIIYVKEGSWADEHFEEFIDTSDGITKKVFE